MKGYFNNYLTYSSCLKSTKKNVLSKKPLRLEQLYIRSRTQSQVQVKIYMHSPRAQQLLKNTPCIFFSSQALAEPVLIDLQGTQQYLSYSGLA